VKVLRIGDYLTEEWIPLFQGVVILQEDKIQLVFNQITEQYQFLAKGKIQTIRHNGANGLSAGLCKKIFFTMCGLQFVSASGRFSRLKVEVMGLLVGQI